MNKIRLYIPPLILGFVIVPLLVWPTVVALAACVITLSFLGEILFSIPLMIRRISLLELQLGLLEETRLLIALLKKKKGKPHRLVELSVIWVTANLQPIKVDNVKYKR
ncbi:UNVERIFIED_CONTAM: hypothetical protein DQE83_17225 [Escherichia coli]